MKSEFLISGIETGQLNAMVKNIMSQVGVKDPKEAVRMMNNNELQVSIIEPKRLWREQDSIIHLSVTSDGTTGKQWTTRLEKRSYRVSNNAKSILLSPDFKPTNGVTTEIAVFKGRLFNGGDRTTRKIRQYADEHNFTPPNAEIACLIREKFTDEEIKAMGLWWIVVMHKPIKDSVGNPGLLGAFRAGDGSWLHAPWDEPDGRWDQDDGFAFAVSQIDS